MTAGLKGQRARVFVVDDDERVLLSLKVVLNRRYDVQVSPSPAGAIAEIRAFDPNVIVLDIRMPVHDGFWVFREVRNFAPTVPIIFNSAHQDEMSEEDLRGAYKPFGYLPKSGKLADFFSCIDAAVAEGKK